MKDLDATEQHLPRGRAAEALGRSRATGQDKRFWKRLGITPVMIAGRWAIKLTDLKRVKGAAGSK